MTMPCKTRFGVLHVFYILALLLFLATGPSGFIVAGLYYHGATDVTMPVWKHWLDLGIISSGYGLSFFGIWSLLQKRWRRVQDADGSGEDSAKNRADEREV